MNAPLLTEFTSECDGKGTLSLVGSLDEDIPDFAGVYHDTLMSAGSVCFGVWIRCVAVWGELGRTITSVRGSKNSEIDIFVAGGIKPEIRPKSCGNAVCIGIKAIETFVTPIVVSGVRPASALIVPFAVEFVHSAAGVPHNGLATSDFGSDTARAVDWTAFGDFGALGAGDSDGGSVPHKIPEKALFFCIDGLAAHRDFYRGCGGVGRAILRAGSIFICRLGHQTADSLFLHIAPGEQHKDQ